MIPLEIKMKLTLEDPLIDEIRRIRRELSERFGNDPQKLGEYLRKSSEERYRKYGLKKADLQIGSR